MRYATLLLVCLTGLAACTEASVATPPQVVRDARGGLEAVPDIWPVAGEVRRDDVTLSLCMRKSDTTTSDCEPVSMRRTAVAAPRGFKPGELYVVTRVERRSDSWTTPEFLGRTDGVSYRYHFGIKAGDGAATGSVERPPISAPGLILGPSDGISRTISCSSKAVRCELMVQRVTGDVVIALFSVRIDERAPGGEVCVASPGPGGGAAQPAIEFKADGKRLISAQAKPGAAQICLGAKSGRALDLISAAGRLEFSVIRAPGDRQMPWDHSVVDGVGMGTAIALEVFLFGHSVATDERVRQEAAFAREAAKLR